MLDLACHVGLTAEATYLFLWSKQHDIMRYLVVRTCKVKLVGLFKEGLCEDHHTDKVEIVGKCSRK